MIDFNREFDLLQQWINYRVDWYATYLEYGKSFFIDENASQRNWTPYEIFRIIREQGVHYINTFLDPISEHTCLTFEQFKERNL